MSERNDWVEPLVSLILLALGILLIFLSFPAGCMTELDTTGNFYSGHFYPGFLTFFVPGLVCLFLSKVLAKGEKEDERREEGNDE